MSYTDQAVEAITAAVEHEHDAAGWIADVLGRVAARVGGSHVITEGRPGSWEAALVRELLAGTVGADDEYLPDPGKDRIMTTCDPSRRPDQATQMMALDVVRRFVTLGSFGAPDVVHDLAATAGCPACAVTATAQFMLAVAAAVSGNEYVTEELSGRILALVDATQQELDAAAN